MRWAKLGEFRGSKTSKIPPKLQISTHFFLACSPLKTSKKAPKLQKKPDNKGPIFHGFE
jgi:hypothetical protein